jgi:hypothetical protein
MPSTLKKKLDRTIWQPRVKHRTAGITIRSVVVGDRGPKDLPLQSPRAYKDATNPTIVRKAPAKIPFSSVKTEKSFSN